MKKLKVFSILCLVFILTLIIYKANANSDYITSNNLKKYAYELSQKDKWFNYKILLVKDIDDLRFMFIKYTLNSTHYMGYIEFLKVSDNKYKFINHSADSFNEINSICINTNFGKNNQQSYNVIYGLIPDKQENRYLITSDSNSFECTFERNVFFAKEFKMNNYFNYHPIGTKIH